MSHEYVTRDHTSETLDGVEFLRVSLAGYAHIGDPETHKIGLLRHERGEFTPVGGSLAVTPQNVLQPGFIRLESLIDGSFGIVTTESERHPNDLRFDIEPTLESIHAVTSWFARGRGHEGADGVLREVIEELGPEEHGPLPLEVAERIRQEGQLTHIGIHGMLRKGNNPRADSKMTLALSKIYELPLPPDILQQLRIKALKEDPSFIFVTPDEIRQGSAVSGQRIGSNAQALLDYAPVESWQDDDPDVTFFRLGGVFFDPQTGEALRKL